MLVVEGVAYGYDRQSEATITGKGLGTSGNTAWKRKDHGPQRECECESSGNASRVKCHSGVCGGLVALAPRIDYNQARYYGQYVNAWGVS